MNSFSEFEFKYDLPQFNNVVSSEIVVFKEIEVSCKLHNQYFPSRILLHVPKEFKVKTKSICNPTFKFL